MNSPVPKSLRTLHLVLLYLLMGTSLIGLIILLSGVIEIPLVRADIYKTAAIYTLNCVLLVFGITYVLRGYSKNAAFYYKAFLTAIAISNGINFVFSPLIKVSVGFLLLGVVQSAALLVLAFGKNLGKRNTWILFTVMTLIQAVVTILVITTPGSANLIGFRFISMFSKLLLFGTIGLSIWGKYADKAARGTK